ncbi:MAG: galactosyldiacylglycerol synthase [Anaerolineae bacterium]|nr:galactosyldiacylglycerol synthase [Anaerolineae bacterium]
MDQEDRRRLYDEIAQPKRFLFLFSDTGGGHRASAQAVKDEFLRLYGARALIEMVDVFVGMDRWPFDRFPKWYPTIVGWNGVPWSVGYHLSDRVRTVKAVSRLAWPYARTALCQLLQRHPADAIVSFHGIPNYALLMARQQLQVPLPMAIVTLDLVTAHAGWFVPGAEMYLVPTEDTRERAQDCGVDPDRIWVTGMPTRRSFVESMTLSKEAARVRLNLPQDRLVILLVGGGEGMGPLAPVVKALAARHPKAQLVVITGRNQALAATLRALDTPEPLRIEGFVSNMDVWMRAVDLLVTKAGPNTISEAFIAGLPMVLYAALPGQEEGNVTHVTDHGAGIWAPRPELAADAVMDLLAHPERLSAMARQSQSLAYPEATENIVQRLWDMAQSPRLNPMYLKAERLSALRRWFD